MEIMVTGIILWSLVHLMPATAPATTKILKIKFGANTFKSVFSILLIISILLMVHGWRNTSASYLYQLPAFILPIAVILILISFLLIGSSILPSRLSRWVVHPQLMFVIFWSAAHLLLNGDSRSVLLFGGLGLWAIVEIFVINRRDGSSSMAATPSLIQEFKSIALSLILFVAAVFGHQYLAGVSLAF